jgi:hypothetical protein
MQTVTATDLARATMTPVEQCEALIGQVVVFDRAAETGGVSQAAGFGADEAAARDDARRTARLARVPEEHLDGEAFLIVAG